MKKALLISFASLLLIFFTSSFELNTVSSSSTIPSCNQGKKIAQKTWEKWGPWKSNLQLDPFNAQVKKLRNNWNWIVKNSGTAVGPRRLEIDGKHESGTIMDQTKSTFVTPPSFSNKVTITINKFDGKAATGVAICTHARSGAMKTVTSYEFHSSTDAKVKTFVINNARGKIITVALKNNSVGNTFKYRIKAK